jgi:Ca2+-binding EF-hand superfamily protein
MSRILSFAVLLGLIVCLSTGADAAAPKKKANNGDPIAALFAKIDTNGDKKISKKEFEDYKGPLHGNAGKENGNVAKENGKAAKGKGMAKDAIFTKLDTNGDGFLTMEEFSKIKEIMAEAKKKKAN